MSYMNRHLSFLAFLHENSFTQTLVIVFWYAHQYEDQNIIILLYMLYIYRAIAPLEDGSIFSLSDAYIPSNNKCTLGMHKQNRC